MKSSLGIIITAILLTSSILTVTWLNSEGKVNAGSPPPTPAPTRTVGPPSTVKNFDGPFLEVPLKKKEALSIAHEFDKQHANWDSPWEVKDMGEGNRITIQWYPDRNYDKTHRYGPSAENGPVWVITIKGRVRLTDMKDTRAHESVTYIIAQNTGHILGIRY